MTPSEDFLISLAAQEELSYAAHKTLATAPSSYVRRLWAGRGDKPKDLVEERLKVETHPKVLRALIEDFESDALITVIERGQTAVILEEIFTRYCYLKEDLALKALKLAKELDPTGYREGIIQSSDLISSASFDLWDPPNTHILAAVITDGPLKVLEPICKGMSRLYWEPGADILLDRITEKLCPETVEALSALAPIKTFTSLKSTGQENIKNLLQSTPSEELSETAQQQLNLLRWWAGLGPEPENNPSVEEIKNAGTAPSELPFKLAMDAPVETAEAFIEGTKLANSASMYVFVQWADKHRREVDYKLVAKWTQEITSKKSVLVDALLTVADNLVKLRPLTPPWLQKSGGLFVEKTSTMEEAKHFPLKEVLAHYRYNREVFSLLSGSDKSLEVFYALADTYEGTLAEFLEVINDFKAENA